jgi:hypothetical protein
MSMSGEVSHVAEVFARATEQAPQVPVLGALMLLSEVVIPREMTVRELASTPFEPGSLDYRYVVVQAVGAHQGADMPPIIMQPNTVAHAKEQVDSQLAMAVAALRTGDDDIHPDNVHPIDPDQVAAADLFLSYSVNRHFVGRLVKSILQHLASSDAAQESLRRYRADVARISVEGHQIEQTPARVKARKERLAARRIVLMEELDPELRQGAAGYMEYQGVEAFLRVMALPDSTPQLLRKHDLIPPEEE